MQISSSIRTNIESKRQVWYELMNPTSRRLMRIPKKVAVTSRDMSFLAISNFESRAKNLSLRRVLQEIRGVKIRQKSKNKTKRL